MNVTIRTTLDLKGLSCPMPIVNTAKAMKGLTKGDVVEVLATDPGSVRDFQAWCKTTRNELLEQSEAEGVFRYVIRKG
ncbi:MAG TPA: sulfurtransferase TusA family protein [Actinomycetota bacterium]|nr:sulfurtransferase TusA family protein [Actinomycetota bacterium]